MINEGLLPGVRLMSVGGVKEYRKGAVTQGFSGGDNGKDGALRGMAGVMERNGSPVLAVAMVVAEAVTPPPTGGGSGNPLVPSGTHRVEMKVVSGDRQAHHIGSTTPDSKAITLTRVSTGARDLP